MARKRSDSDGDFPLLKYLDQLTDTLRTLVPAALKDHEEDAIHDARVATRRLKAALDLMRPVLSNKHRKPFSRALRDLRRTLGEMRDLDVMLDHARKLRGTTATRPAITWLVKRLEGARDEARQDAAKDASPPRVLARLGAWWGVRAEIDEAREATDSLLANSLHLQLDAFCEQADILAKLRELANDHVHDPHALRIAGKLLRYTLEMAAEEGHKLPAGVMRSFKRVQESLGLWHDFVVLTERAMCESSDAMLAHHDAPLQRQVLTLSQATLRTSERHLANVVRLWKSRGEQLTQAIRASFPLTQSVAPTEPAPAPQLVPTEPVTAPQTDPGPTG